MYRFWNEEAIAAVDNHVDQIGTSVANAVIDLIEEKEIPMNIEVPYDLEEGTSLLKSIRGVLMALLLLHRIFFETQGNIIKNVKILENQLTNCKK